MVWRLKLQSRCYVILSGIFLYISYVRHPKFEYCYLTFKRIMKFINYLLTAGLFIIFFNKATALWCYECVSNQPGCGEPFNWLWHWTTICPEENDVCVKILEVKDAETVITRSCLSSLIGKRTDIPADRYEGCRLASLDVKLANYVNNSIKELDIKRDYYDSTTWCFCFLDHRCNGSSFVTPSTVTVLVSVLLSIHLTFNRLF